ncbi:hypothetical protein BKP45_03295 [Anaerobacillus alkalidiazotrophicus]|uniref:Uncharacterized protein n=1 Tax=Anaerobacillus alkalidiazotrophicus TaxID=472963 RepID=A0A1S2MD20_9BACI|nr:hypothetical protein [Anaerobacillus alkalidiazotrophicus]OIJ21737.1 hypothetical protein BKP45_03295 [Anaerobacillus alkalidiazotrophicus]
MLTQGMLMVIIGIAGIVITFIVFFMTIYIGRKAVTKNRNIADEPEKTEQAPEKKQVQSPVQSTALLDEQVESEQQSEKESRSKSEVASTVLLNDEINKPTELYETELMEKEK